MNKQNLANNEAFKSEKISRSEHVHFLSQQIQGFTPLLVVAVVSKILLKITPFIITFLLSLFVGYLAFDSSQIVWTLLWFVLGLIIAHSVFIFMDIYFSHAMSYMILTKLRNVLYRKIDQIAPGGIDKERSGDLISTVLHDVEFFEWFYAHVIVEWIALAIISTAILCFMASFSWILPLGLLPFIVLIILIPRFYRKQADVQGLEVRTTAGIANSIIIDGIQGVKDILSFQWEEGFFNQFTHSSAECQKAELTYAKRSSQEKRCITASVEVGSLVAMALIIVLFLQGKLDEIWILPLFTLSFSLFSPLQDAMGLSTNYGFIYGAAERVAKILKTPMPFKDEGQLGIEEVARSKKAPAYQGADHTADSWLETEKKDQDFLAPQEPAIPCVLSLESVSFSYPSAKSVPVVRDVSFEINPGETLALVGRSGCGKSTISKLVQRFWDPDAGRISINGIDIKDIAVDSLRNLVSTVSQDVYMFNGSIKDNLLLARPQASEEDIIIACKLAHIADYIDTLPQGYETQIGDRGARLSGGQRQRIAIARAFLRNSPILILDEVTANLDENSEQEIIEALQSLKKNRSTLVISHRPSTIKLADRILHLTGQGIEAEGSFDELLKRDQKFKQLLDA